MSGKKKSGGGAVATLTREESIGGTTRAKLVTVPSNIVIRQMELRDVSAAFHLGEACEYTVVAPRISHLFTVHGPAFASHLLSRLLPLSTSRELMHRTLFMALYPFSLQELWLPAAVQDLGPS
jgi:hypothetical protein